MRTFLQAVLVSLVVGTNEASFRSRVIDNIMTLSEEGRLSPSARAELRASLKDERDAAKLDFAEKGLYFYEPKHEIVVDLPTVENLDPLAQRNRIEIVVVTDEATPTTLIPRHEEKAPASFLATLYQSITDLFSN